MPHVPRTHIHLYAGRFTSLETKPIAGLTAAELDKAVFVVNDLFNKDHASMNDTAEGVVIRFDLTPEDTEQIGRGKWSWQVLPVGLAGLQFHPIAEGRLTVSPTYQGAAP